jgi:hypothetical protein
VKTSDLDYTLRQINAGSVFIQLLFPMVEILQNKMQDVVYLRRCSGDGALSSEERCNLVEGMVRKELDLIAQIGQRHDGGDGSTDAATTKSSTLLSPDGRRKSLLNSSHAPQFLHDSQEYAGKPSKCACCRFWLQPFLVLIMFWRSLAPGLVYLLTEPLVPKKVPILGGRSLTEISFLARAINTRMHVLCWLPIELAALRGPFPVSLQSEKKKKKSSGHERGSGSGGIIIGGAVLPPDARVRRHVAVYSTLCVLVLDIALGVFIGGFGMLHSSRSDVILTQLHDLAEILHMDVLTTWTVWLMGVPIGLKLNSGLASFLGAFVLTVLKLWNVFTSAAAPIEGAILITIACSGVLGVTTLLATLLDLLRFVVPHVWLIYSAFAKMHAALLYVLQSLWYLFRGKKRNVLRSRVDTFEMTLDQQLVGTILFAIVSFLSITPFVFYTFWAAVWACVLFTHSLLWMILSFFSTVPLYEMWILLFSQAGGAHKGPGMLPGSIRFTVTQVSRDEEDGTGEENVTQHRFAGDLGSEPGGAGGAASYANSTSDKNRGIGSVGGTGKRSSPLSPSQFMNDEDNTLYLHLTGDPVSMGKLFTATKQYVQHCLSQNSFGIFSRSFLMGRLVTPLTRDHPHLDHHLHRSETLCRDDALPDMGRLWNALQQLTKHYYEEDPDAEGRDESESDSESE